MRSICVCFSAHELDFGGNVFFLNNIYIYILFVYIILLSGANQSMVRRGKIGVHNIFVTPELR